jgi:glycosyltransferase involved in cell wall biosynthesis
VTLELINALIDCLASNQQAIAPVIAKLSIIVADGPMPDILKTIAARAGDMVTVVRIHDLRQRFKDDNAPRFDLIHRPFQLTSSRDLLFLLTAARRFIVSQLDCIAYANPSYALNAESWLAYRQLTERVFAMADGISYISADAQHDARHRGLLIPDERECVAYVGVDHQLHRPKIGAETSPEASTTAAMTTLLAKIGAASFILVLGTNFRHKNRVYAIRMLQALIAKHAWSGNVVFAGPNVTAGGSVQEEAEAVTSDFAQRVIYLGAIDETQKNLLMQKSALVLYPSNYEGFGMVPFEAAQVGVPCLALRNTSVAEVLGDEVRYLESNDPQAGVELVWQMLAEPDAATTQVAAINARAARFNWGMVAQDTLAFYDRGLCLPARRAELHSPRGGVLSAGAWGEPFVDGG